MKILWLGESVGALQADAKSSITQVTQPTEKKIKNQRLLSSSCRPRYVTSHMSEASAAALLQLGKPSMAGHV